jgi:hypothetical protein
MRAITSRVTAASPSRIAADSRVIRADNGARAHADGGVDGNAVTNELPEDAHVSSAA